MNQPLQPANPFVGGIVLYASVGRSGKLLELPSIIVSVHTQYGEAVNLRLFLDEEEHVYPADSQDSPQAGTWRWPPRS
jgi:hypothetical protein